MICSNTPTTRLNKNIAAILRMVKKNAETGNTRSEVQTSRENTSIQKPKSKLVQLIRYRKKCNSCTKSTPTEKKLLAIYTRKKKR